jgi:hypothetical protein
MKTIGKVKLDFEVQLNLNEGELRALDALVGYGFQSFVDAFYEKLGKHYMQPYEKNLKTLFEKIEELRPCLGEIDNIRKAASIIQGRLTTV